MCTGAPALTLPGSNSDALLNGDRSYIGENRKMSGKNEHVKFLCDICRIIKYSKNKLNNHKTDGEKEDEKEDEKDDDKEHEKEDEKETEKVVDIWRKN